MNTLFRSPEVRSSGAVSSDLDKVSNEDVSAFNQCNCSSTQDCSSSTTAPISSVVPQDASSVILTASGVNSGPGAEDCTGGVLGYGVSLRSSSNSEYDSEAAATGLLGSCL